MKKQSNMWYFWKPWDTRSSASVAHNASLLHVKTEGLPGGSSSLYDRLNERNASREGGKTTDTLIPLFLSPSILCAHDSCQPSRTPTASQVIHIPSLQPARGRRVAGVGDGMENSEGLER